MRTFSRAFSPCLEQIASLLYCFQMKMKQLILSRADLKMLYLNDIHSLRIRGYIAYRGSSLVYLNQRNFALQIGYVQKAHCM